MAWASRGALLRSANGLSGGSAGRRSLAASSVSTLRRSSRSYSSPITTGYYYATVPTCLKSDRRSLRQPLPSATLISPPGIAIGGCTLPRLLSSSSAMQYFEGPWYEKYLLLEQYKKEHGNCIVPISFVSGDAKLGHWVNNQRSLYKNRQLSTNRREMLDALGFSWDPKGDKWERSFALLEQYKKREGDCNVPKKHEEEGNKLGIWLSTQRTAMKQGRLDKSYQGRLENLGVAWDPFSDQWERNFGLLEQHKEREGHCNVPVLHEKDGVKLGVWLDNQRKRMKQGRLDESYQGRLERLGVSFDRHRDQWERNFALLEQFKEREGHCNVPRSHEEDGIKLGIWLNRIRQARKGNRRGRSLSLEQIERLDKLGVVWDPFEDQWKRNFALLEQFIEREGHCNVPMLYEESGIKLGWWLQRIRQARKGNGGNNLSSERIEKLENLGVIWDPFEDQWERNFALLEQFNQREGHCNAPHLHEEDGINLGRWLHRLRQVRKGNRDGNLSSERIERLESLGMIWESLEDQWERNFALLEQYIEREGHCNVPQSHEESGIKLGIWLNRLRQVRKGNKDGNLSPEQIGRLENIGVVWDQLDDQWEQKIALLEQFKEREGHCNVPYSYEESGIKLGRWLSDLRKVRKGKGGSALCSERTERLNEIGIRW